MPQIGHRYSISMKALKYYCNDCLSNKLSPQFFMLSTRDETFSFKSHALHFGQKQNLNKHVYPLTRIANLSLRWLFSRVFQEIDLKKETWRIWSG